MAAGIRGGNRNKLVVGKIRIIYVIAGMISIILGIIGIFVPGLPTTPFLLLSSWLFYRSSKRLHRALHRSRWLGAYIRRYESGKGVGWGSKLISILLMWIMITISTFYFIENLYVKYVIFFLGAIGTCCVLFVVPGRSLKAHGR